MGHYEVTSLSRSLNLVINTFKYVEDFPKWAILNDRSTKNEIINILGCARGYFPMCPKSDLKGQYVRVSGYEYYDPILLNGAR